MSEVKKNIMTYEGVKKLEEELEFLKTVKRKEITEKIKVALGFGDLSENAEYTEAKNEQAFVEGRIVQLENLLKNTNVVDEADTPRGVANIGSKVTVKDFDLDETIEYYIVGSAEADPINGKISNESPVGAALIGKRKGDVVEANSPTGIIKMEVMKVSRA